MAMKKMPGGGQGKRVGKMTASGSGITGARAKVTGTPMNRKKDPTYMGRDAKGGVVRKIQRGR